MLCGGVHRNSEHRIVSAIAASMAFSSLLAHNPNPQPKGVWTYSGDVSPAGFFISLGLYRIFNGMPFCCSFCKIGCNGIHFSDIMALREAFAWLLFQFVPQGQLEVKWPQ